MERYITNCKKKDAKKRALLQQGESDMFFNPMTSKKTFKKALKKTCTQRKHRHKHKGDSNVMFPKLLPNVDLMFPVILSYLKEHAGHTSYFMKLAEKEILKEGSINGETSNKTIQFYLSMGHKNHTNTEDLLLGLSEYIDFRFHSHKNIKISLKLVLDKALEELKPYLKNISYRLCLPKELPELKTDPESIFIIFKNLLQSRIERGEDYHKKLVTHLKVKEVSEGMVFNFQDNGPEIPTEERKLFFSVFKRNLSFSSMRIGLASKYSALLGGKVWIESSTPSKTILSFYLPNE